MVYAPAIRRDTGLPDAPIADIKNALRDFPEWESFSGPLETVIAPKGCAVEVSEFPCDIRTVWDKNALDMIGPAIHLSNALEDAGFPVRDCRWWFVTRES